jgi:tight adherence protein B
MNTWPLWPITLLLLAAAWLLMKSAERQTEQAIGDSTASVRQPRRLAPRDTLVEWVQDYLVSAGVPASPRAIMVAGGLLVGVIIVLLSLLGSRWGPLLVVGGLLLLNAGMRLRAGRIRRRARSQLGPFMEQVMRHLASGQSLEIAFRHGARRAPEPLGEVLQRIVVRRDLGLELHEGLAREAQLLKLYELRLLATAVQVSQVHGGSLKEILHSFVTLLRQQERGRRELSAMTGETRVTAVVLGLVPVAMAAFLYTSNPEFVAPMLESEGGRMALGMAVVLQLAGALALWRMLKSV